jgi:hypothetical protein
MLCRYCERSAVPGEFLCEIHGDEEVRSHRERSIRNIGCRRRRPRGEWDQGSGSFDDAVKVIEG